MVKEQIIYSVHLTHGAPEPPLSANIKAADLIPESIKTSTGSGLQPGKANTAQLKSAGHLQLSARSATHSGQIGKILVNSAKATALSRGCASPLLVLSPSEHEGISSMQISNGLLSWAARCLQRCPSAWHPVKPATAGYRHWMGNR